MLTHEASLPLNSCHEEPGMYVSSLAFILPHKMTPAIPILQMKELRLREIK